MSARLTGNSLTVAAMLVGMAGPGYQHVDGMPTPATPFGHSNKWLGAPMVSQAKRRKNRRRSR